MVPTPLKIRPWAGFYAHGLVLAAQTCNSALGGFTGIAGTFNQSSRDTQITQRICPYMTGFLLDRCPNMTGAPTAT